MGDDRLIKSTCFILELIHQTQNQEMERENLKQYVKLARDILFEETGIVLDFDFMNYPSNLDSNKLDEILEYSIASNLLIEKYGSVIYQITPRGQEFLDNPPEIIIECLNEGNFRQTVRTTITRLFENHPLD